MARPKKDKAEPAAKAGGPVKPGDVGHNSGRSDDELAAVFFHHQKRWEAAKSALSIVEEEAKTAIGKHAIRDFRTAVAMETPEGEERVKEKIEAQMRVARWLGLAFGTQAEMFAEDRTPGVDRAYAEGKLACMQNKPRKPPHDPSVPQYQSWMDGYDAGQAVLLQAFKPLAPDDDRDLRPESLRRAEAEKAGDGTAAATH